MPDDDPTPIRWGMTAVYCPICIVDFDWDEDEYPPLLGPVGEVDHSVDPFDIHAGDGVDRELFERRNEVEPRLWCRECDSIFAVDLVP